MTHKLKLNVRFMKHGSHLNIFFRFFYYCLAAFTAVFAILILPITCFIFANDLTQEPQVLMSYSQAAILGLVEGITEYLPVSSTGHLILVDAFLGFRGNSALSQSQMDAIDAFEIVIQGGAILAVIFAYWPKVKDMFRGLLGQNSDGKKLLFNVVAAFLPAATIGFVLHKIIKKYLQQEWPAVFALAIGGIVMILFEKSQLAKMRKISGLDVNQLTIKGAVIIGLLQCIAMWPGTSRSMMTILGGILVGLTPAAAAEFSFLLGLPTLLAATGFKAIKHGPELVSHIGFDTMAVGLVVAAISAFICVRGFISWLTKFGLAPFGYYRIVLSVVVAVYLLTTQSQ